MISEQFMLKVSNTKTHSDNLIPMWNNRHVREDILKQFFRCPIVFNVNWDSVMSLSRTVVSVAFYERLILVVFDNT